MSLPYPGWSVVYGEQPTATKWSEIGANTDALAAGTGLNSGAVTGASMAAATVAGANLKNGLIYRRQGGDSSVWNTAGTTTYNTSATDPLWQVGSVNISPGSTAVTFPVAYVSTPLIVGAPTSFAASYPSWYIVSASNTGFTIQVSGGQSATPFMWIAVGI